MKMSAKDKKDAKKNAEKVKATKAKASPTETVENSAPVPAATAPAVSSLGLESLNGLDKLLAAPEDGANNPLDQIIENLQRDNLTPMEIATFIKSELDGGAQQKDIAKAIGKSTAYVNQHVTLLKLPDFLTELYNSGRCQDVTSLNVLYKIHKTHPKELAKWCKADEISRASVKAFKDFLEYKQQKPQNDTQQPEAQSAQGYSPEPGYTSPEQGPEVIKNGAVEIHVFVIENRAANTTTKEGIIIFDKVPAKKEKVWILFQDGKKAQVPVSKVTITHVIQAQAQE